jgi:hypothetical protein
MNQPTFTCTGCDETYPVCFRIRFDGEEACPHCAEFWSQDAVRKLRQAEMEDAERDAARLAASYRSAA